MIERNGGNGAASYLGLSILDLLIICSVGVALMDGHGHACALVIILVQFFGLNAAIGWCNSGHCIVNESYSFALCTNDIMLC